MNSDHREAESARKGGLSPASPQDRDLRTDASDDRFDIGHHLCHIEPKYAIPRAYQGPIAPLIEPLACTVVEPIDLDDELHLGSEQIENEPTEQRDLSSKRDPDSPTAEGMKENLFGGSGGVTHDCRALIELQASGLRNGRDVEHGILLGPSRGAGRERPRRTIRDVRQQADARRTSSMARTVRHEAVPGPLAWHQAQALTARREARPRTSAVGYVITRAERLAPDAFWYARAMGRVEIFFGHSAGRLNERHATSDLRVARLDDRHTRSVPIPLAIPVVP